MITSENLEIPIIIQLDSNTHLGNKVILSDPNPLANANGKLMNEFLHRTNLTVVKLTWYLSGSNY